MAKVITGSQSLLLLPHLQPHDTLTGRRPSILSYRGITISQSYKPVLSSRPKSAPTFIPVSRASSLDLEVPGEAVDSNPDPTTGGGGGDEASGQNRGGGGGGGDGGGDHDDQGSDEGSDGKKKNKALLMSQKITLAYAALVGLGGFMGYLKSGSQKSLAAGGLSSLLLYYVYTELPKRPVFASSVGLGLSAALLVVMGSRFKRSGKVFPAGVVSLVSLIMTGGYVHGIMKTH